MGRTHLWKLGAAVVVVTGTLSVGVVWPTAVAAIPVSIDPSGPVTLTLAGEYEFVVPVGVTHVNVDLIGGSGGGNLGGRAAQINTIVPVVPGVRATLVVGSNGREGPTSNVSPFSGGDAGTGRGLSPAAQAYSGGDATALSLDGVAVTVAAGGGGQGGEGNGHLLSQGVGGAGGDAGLLGANAASGTCGTTRSDATVLGGSGGLGATSAGPGAPGALCSQFAFHGATGSPGVIDRGGSGAIGATDNRLECGSAQVFTAGPGGGGGGGRFGGAGGGAGYLSCELATLGGQVLPATGGGGGGGGSSYVTPAAPVINARLVALGSAPRAVISYVFGADRTPPVVTVPASPLVVEASGPAGAVVTYAASATDRAPSSPTVTCVPASGSVFPLGDSPVACSATDSAGNVGTATFTVRVVDTTAPALDPVGDHTAEATSPSGTAVSYPLPAATDAVSAPAVVCAPLSGSVFALGSTPISCAATDAAGNSSTVSGSVTVADTTPPTWTTFPSDIVVTATSATGASVQYAVPTAADVASASVTVACDRASGATFSVGTSRVGCTATDAAGQTISRSLVVTVQPSLTPYELVYTTGDVSPRPLAGAAFPSSAVVSVAPNLPANDRRLISVGYVIVSPTGRVTLTSRTAAPYSLPPRSFSSGMWKISVVIVERDGSRWVLTTRSATFSSV